MFVPRSFQSFLPEPALGPRGYRLSAETCWLLGHTNPSLNCSQLALGGMEPELRIPVTLLLMPWPMAYAEPSSSESHLLLIGENLLIGHCHLG